MNRLLLNTITLLNAYSLKGLYFLIVLLIYAPSYAQPSLDWANQIGSDIGGQDAEGLNTLSYEIDSEGNSYYLGYLRGTVDVDPGSSVTLITSNSVETGVLYFVSKLNFDGSFAWVKSFPNTNQEFIIPSKLKIDKEGNPIIVGTHAGTMDFDLDPLSTTLITANFPVGSVVPNTFITKWNSEGEYIWATTISSNGISYACSDFTFDSKNDLYITANSIGTIANPYQDGTPTINFGDSNPVDVLGLYIAKFSSDGSFKWVKSDSLNAYPAAITIDSFDKIIITGSFGGTTPNDFNLNTTQKFGITSSGGSGMFQGINWGDAFILKLDAEANFIWAKNIGGNVWNCSGNLVKTDEFGNLIIVGSFVAGDGQTTTLDIDITEQIMNLTTKYTGTMTNFILKTNPSGDFIWANVLHPKESTGLSYISAVDIDKCGNIYIGANLKYFNDINPDTLVEVLVSNTNHPDGEFVVAKFDADFKFNWAHQFGFGAITNSIHVDKNYSIYIQGFSKIIENDKTNLTDINPDANITTPLQLTGLDNVFFVKFNQTPPPPLSLSASINPICPGQESVITAIGADTYTWTPTTGESSNAGATYTVKPSITTKYIVQGISNNCVLTDTITISTTTATPTNAGKDTAICEGSSVMLKATDYTTTNWSTGATTAEISVAPTETTSYVFSTTNNNCPITDTVVVTVNSLPIIGLSPFISIPKGSSTVLNASGGGSYLWTPIDGLSCSDCASPTATPEVETDYCVTVTNENNCVSKACEKVKFDVVCGDLFIPNGFSPNGDNLNDKLEVKINPNCVSDFNFMIFDRWGEKVFETDKITVDWDGKFNGKELDNAVFVYYAKVKLIDSSNYIVKKGNVSILR